jgi:hypothetical protein
MCVAALVRDLPTFARYLALFFNIHSGESS